MCELKSYTQDYLDTLYTGHAYHKIKVKFGSVEVVDNIVKMKYISMMHDGDSVTFGNSCAAQVELTIDSPPSNATSKNVTIDLGVEIDDGDDETENEIEWVALGKFVITDKKIEKTQITYIMYDYMASKLNKRYRSFLDWSGGVNMSDIEEEITGATGIEFSFGTAMYDDGVNLTINSFPRQCTYRDMIGFMAGMTGRDAVINADGEIEYRCYKEVADFSIGADSVYEDEYKKNEEDSFNFKKVECKVSDNDEDIVESTARTATGAFSIISVANPYITQSIMTDYIYPASGRTKSKFFTTNFTPTEIKMIGNPAIEVGDVIKIYEDSTHWNWAYVMKITHEYDGGLITTIESTSETEEAQALQYVSPTSGGSSGGGGGNITVDSAMSSTSTNPVQNKVIYAYIGDIGSVLDAIQGEVI